MIFPSISAPKDADASEYPQAGWAALDDLRAAVSGSRGVGKANTS